MTPLVLVLACALVAPLHAASLPHQHKISEPLPDDSKHPSPDNQEIIAPEPAKDVGNELRVKPEDIPVQVLVEDQPSVKFNEIDDEEIKRPAVDLRNPGPPQRQEHETQNPEQHTDEQLKITSIQQSIERTQDLLRESFQGVSDNIQNWINKNDDQSHIQKNIQNLRDTLTGQIQTLKATVQAYIKPEVSESVEVKEEETQRKYDEIQSRFKILEDNFNNDMETLSAGINLVANLRSTAEGNAVKEEASAEPAAPSPPAQPAAAPSNTEASQNPLGVLVNIILERVSTGVQTIQSTLGFQASNPPAAAQADTPTQTGSGPFNNFFNRPNNASFFPQFPMNWGNGTNNLFSNSSLNPANWFSNRPLQGWLEFLNPSTAKPVETASINPAADKPAVSSPEAAPEKPADAPAPAQAPAPAAQPAEPQPGPIRQFLSNNPIVQRIQNSINNRDTPRDPAEKSDGQTKAGWYGRPKPPGAGDNNNSGVSEKSEEIKEPIKEEPIKEEPNKEEPIKKEPIKEEPIKEESKKEEADVRPESIPEKTE